MSKRFIVFIGFLVLISISIFAQENSRSTIIKWIDGEKFYIHKVTQGQGLFSITKIYNVEQKEILENNPQVFDGLKPGQELKIPFKKPIVETSKYRIHIIEAGQSIYSISKMYHVTQESIFAINPEVKNGYKINQKIKIPLEENKSEQKEPLSTDNKKYKVKKKDTLYALSKKFDVTQDALIEANPIIKKDGLQKGQKLIIPGREKIIKEALYIPIDTMYYDGASLLDSNKPCDSIINNRTTAMEVGLFLPFEIDKTVFNNEKNSNSQKKPKISNKPFLEFYQGFLMAIEQLKANGEKLNIHVFNTKRDSNELKRILKQGIIRELDLIIGPVYKENFKIVQRATDSLSIPMINPIIKESGIVKNSTYSIDIFPSNQVFTDQMIKFIIQNDSSQIFFVHSGFVDDLVIANPFKQSFNKTLKLLGKDTVNTFKELIFPNSKKINFKPFLNKNKHNLVVILSDNQAFVSNVFTKLNNQSEDFDIQLIARPKWIKFDNIDLSYYHNLNTLLFTNEFIDYHNPNVNIFIKKYRTIYNIEPSKYSFYAYDISFAFTSYFYQFDNFRCLKDFETEHLIFGFDFQKANKGLMNHSIFIVQYKKDFSVEKVFQINDKIIDLRKNLE